MEPVDDEEERRELRWLCEHPRTRTEGPANAYSFEHEGKRYWPFWQFGDGDKLLFDPASFPKDRAGYDWPHGQHPVAVSRFFTTTFMGHPVRGQHPLTPREWLKRGFDIEAVHEEWEHFTGGWSGW